jgi:hypothetical protein
MRYECAGEPPSRTRDAIGGHLELTHATNDVSSLLTTPDATQLMRTTPSPLAAPSSGGLEGLCELPHPARRGGRWSRTATISEGLGRPPHVILPGVKEITRLAEIALVAPPNLGGDGNDSRRSSKALERFLYPVL